MTPRPQPTADTYRIHWRRLMDEAATHHSTRKGTTMSMSKQEAMQLAFQTVIDEIFFWVNKDKAHNLSDDITDRHNLDDAWTEIALRLERWQQHERVENADATEGQAAQ